MSTAYEDEVLNATQEELAEDPLFGSAGIAILGSHLEGEYPDTKVIVTYTRDAYTATKSFFIYNGSYPGGAERPPVDTIAAIIATNILD